MANSDNQYQRGVEHGDAAPLVEISFQELSVEALRGIIESFVLREGTEYGEDDVGLEEKVLAVREQLRSGEAVIVYDPSEQSVDIRSSTGAS